MRYHSTRRTGSEAPASFCDILLGGLAPDGGLYLPQEYPQLQPETLSQWRRILKESGYAALATEVLSLFIDDIPREDLAGICQRAYRSPAFSDPDIVPVSRLDERLWLAHLSYGPTAAFKDMAMQLLGELFEYELSRRGQWLTIVGATSGDTGSSAEYALRGRDGLSVVMLTPAGRMTGFQRAQMYSLMDDNIINVAVEGVFDDCQDLVKALNMDADFKAQWHIGAVNSINWARVAAQIIYYVVTWLRMSENIAPENPDSARISVCVPSGNFGNICAAHIARSMGIPLDALIVATNENDVLDEFFREGIYRVRSASNTYATSSPSMDISKASNFERFIHDLLGGDSARVADLFGEKLSTEGAFDLSHDPAFQRIAADYGFRSGSSRHRDRSEEIARTYHASGYILDPHTADGVHVARHYAGAIETPIVVMETALPVKFADTIIEAIGRGPDIPERFAGIEDLPQKVVDMTNSVEALKDLISTQVRPGA